MPSSSSGKPDENAGLDKHGQGEQNAPSAPPEPSARLGTIQAKMSQHAASILRAEGSGESGTSGAGVPGESSGESAGAGAGEGQSSPPKPKKAKRKELAPELIPYKEEMEKWVNRNMSTVKFFLEDRDSPFKIVYGDWFYYTPKKNEICLGVAAFKEAKEALAENLAEGAFTVDQIMFFFLHEMAHLKTTRELNRAGKIDLLQHFKTIAGKKIESNDKPGEYVSLAGTYGQFYNILEDSIVNRMVLNTVHYMDATKRREVRDLYVKKIFSIYKKSEPGKGRYVIKEDENRKKEMVKAKDGNGDFDLVTDQDYRQGFDLRAYYHNGEPLTGLTLQFLIAFIKSQMEVFKADEVSDQESFPEGNMKVDTPVAAVFKEPIGKLYRRLFTSIIEKHKNDPAKLKRYLDFMGTAYKVPKYRENKGKIVESHQEVFVNVFNPAFRGEPNLADQAWLGYLRELEKTGIKDAKKMTLIQLFNKFKELQSRSFGRFTLPFIFNSTERTDIIIRAIEPIFTMLCILDDSFDINLPPPRMPGEGDGEGEEGEEDSDQNKENQSSEDQEEDLNAPWRKGVEIINDNRLSPNYGRKGQIINVYNDSDGNVTDVDVAYYSETENPQIHMAIGTHEFSGEEENISDPVNNLIILSKKATKKPGQGKEQKIKYRNPDIKEEKPEEQKQQEQQEQPGQPEDRGQQGQQEQQGRPSQQDKGMDELKKIFGNLIDALENEIEKDEENARAEAFDKIGQEPEYQQKKSGHAREQKLLDMVQKKLAQKETEEQPQNPVSPEEIEKRRKLIRDFVNLEKQIYPIVNRMAAIWLEYIKNVVQEISLVKTKYHARGKMVPKRVQQKFPQIEQGENIDNMRLREQWEEEIRTQMRPKMIRIHLMIDNSGSMADLIEKIRMAVMVVNSSLRSLRALFRTELQALLGDSYTPDLDLVCDLRISLFGATSGLTGPESREIKPFEITDLEFLKMDPRLVKELPKIDTDQEAIATIISFQKIDANEGKTLDSKSWTDLVAEYKSHPELLESIRKNLLTDVILQVSDGAIGETEISQPAISELCKMGVHVGGLALGANAKPALEQRHGQDETDPVTGKVKKKVITANSPEEIVGCFEDFLRGVIENDVEPIMLESIAQILSSND